MQPLRITVAAVATRRVSEGDRMRTIKITAGLTVTAELSVYDPRTPLPQTLDRYMMLSLQNRLVDLMRRAALDAARERNA